MAPHDYRYRSRAQWKKKIIKKRSIVTALFYHTSRIRSTSRRYSWQQNHEKKKEKTTKKKTIKHLLPRLWETHKIALLRPRPLNSLQILLCVQIYSEQLLHHPCRASRVTVALLLRRTRKWWSGPSPWHPFNSYRTSAVGSASYFGLKPTRSTTTRSTCDARRYGTKWRGKTR